MKIDNLRSLGEGSVVDTDLVIIGSGPAGYAIAREFAGSDTRVVVLESGQEAEGVQFEALNAVESVGQPMGEAQVSKRRAFHGESASFWSHETQQFGVRCRVLGGSSHAWSGKSAAFSAIDFAQRDWVPYSGWPFGLETIDPYIDRAGEVLSLGPNCYDERVWTLMNMAAPGPAIDPQLLKSFFWQFARSPVNKLDFIRFGREFLNLEAPNIQILVNATVTGIRTDPQGAVFEGLEVSTIDGARSTVRARAAVLAAGGIENARLLLNSARDGAPALGNGHDMVGRFLMDHPSTTIGRFKADDCKPITDRFGFYGLSGKGHVHMYLHGLVLSPELQKRERLLNCAAYMMEERAADDPWDAIKRLLKGKSANKVADLRAVVSSPGLLARGLGARLMTGSVAPKVFKHRLVDGMVRYFPNAVVREYRDRGLPHKLTGIMVDAITEQQPDPDSRIVLSQAQDSLGQRLARADWRIDTEARSSLIRMGHLLASEFPKVGLPAPTLEPWVANEAPEQGVIIDMAHTIGATRMSSDPRTGVVDANAQVHGVAGLYVAGASVFPTSGHANPTLMIMALAIRLADHLKASLR